jgi:hypothetical protein
MTHNDHIRTMFATFDAKDVSGLAAFVTDDVRLRLGKRHRSREEWHHALEWKRNQEQKWTRERRDCRARVRRYPASRLVSGGASAGLERPP